MNDAGTGGDATAGDGIYSATVPAQADATITQFYVRATAPGGEVNESAAQRSRSVPAMWIVDNAPPDRTARAPWSIASSSPSTTATPSATRGWSSKYDWDFPRMSNFEFNATVILGETSFAGGPEVLYNCGMRKGGSPWTAVGRQHARPHAVEIARRRALSQPVQNRRRQRRRRRLPLPQPHRPLLALPLWLSGARPRIHPAGRQRGPPAHRRRHGADGQRLFQPGYADSEEEGELYEIDDAWFMFDQAPTSPGARTAHRCRQCDRPLGADRLDGTVRAPTSPSADSPIFFHGNWPLRFPEDRGTTTRRWRPSSRSTVTGMPASDAWRDQMSRQLDIERAAIYAAVRGYIGEWDNFTLNRGKNGYFYRRAADGKFEFHHWDSDLAFQSAGRRHSSGARAGTGWTNLTGASVVPPEDKFLSDRTAQQVRQGFAAHDCLADGDELPGGQSATRLAPFKTSVLQLPGMVHRSPDASHHLHQWRGQQCRIAQLHPAVLGHHRRRPDGEHAALHPRRSRPVTGVHRRGRRASGGGLGLDSGHHQLRQMAAHRDRARQRTEHLERTGARPAKGRSWRQRSLQRQPDPQRAAAGRAPGQLHRHSTSPSTNRWRSMPPAAAIPKAGRLAFIWNVTPSAGAVPHPDRRRSRQVRFTQPGLYALDLGGHRPGRPARPGPARSHRLRRRADFSHSAPAPTLDPGLDRDQSPAARQLRRKTPGIRWRTSRVRSLIQVLDRAPLPLNGGTFPSVTQDLPDTGDWILQTNIIFDTRAVGDFQTGLIFDVTEAGQPVRYVFGPEGRSSLTIRRSVAGGPFTSLLGAVRLNAGGPELVWKSTAPSGQPMPISPGARRSRRTYTYGFSNPDAQRHRPR